jgi:type I restriction enzyme, S subunit
VNVECRQLRYDVAELKTGPFGSALSAGEYVDAGVALINPSDLKGGRVVAETAVKVPPGVAERMAAYQLRDGDVVVARRGELGRYGLVGAADAGALCGTGSLLVRPSARLAARFFGYYLETTVARDWLSLQSVGSTMDNLSESILARLPIPAIPRVTQECVADFLDEQTARIDSLIAEKEALYERLFEYFESAISFRILGQDVAGPRTRTNIAEVPEVPKDWALTPMMRLTDPSRPIMYGIVLPGPNVEDGPSVPIVKGGDVRPHRLKLALLNRTTPEIELPYARARLAEGDIVYSIRGTIGDAELVPAELAGANITQDVARIAPRSGIDRRWLLFAAKSRPVFAQLDQLSLGAAVRGINIFDLKRARVPTPPPGVQRCIADELSSLGERISTLREHCIGHIQRLREYRSSLISAAVTGQLDLSRHDGKAAVSAEEALA